MNLESLSTSIDWCLDQLKAEQNPDGSFISTTREFCRGTLVTSHHRRTTFYPSAITLALQSSPAKIAEEIRGQAVSFLLHEAGPSYEYRYWSHDQTNLPDYPPDLDDTLLALAAIHSVDDRLITGRCLAWLLRHLIGVETKPGGPYRTWLFSPGNRTAWQDIDGVVNTNIYYALCQLGIKAPGLADYCRTIVNEQRWHSPYYIGIWPMLYSLSRLNLWKKDQTHWATIWQEYIHSPNDTLSQALVLSSAIRTRYNDQTNLQRLVTKLVNACSETNKELDQCSFIMERHGVDTTELSGARGWTLATIVEALELYKQKFYPDPKINPNTAAQACYSNATEKAKQRFFYTPEPLKKLATNALAKIIKLDKHQEIGLAAFYTNLYLNSPLDQNIVEELGQINMLGWLAQTIYDDWTDENTSQSPLALAQIAWREVGTAFNSRCQGQPQLNQWINKLLDEVDATNGLESLANQITGNNTNLILPENKPHLDFTLNCKSIGHTIPIGITFSLGKKFEKSTLDGVEQMFRHYLSAKQICDDIHDWEADLKARRLTLVIRLILEQFRLENPHIESINLDTNLNTLRTIFWKQAMPASLQLAADWITQATSWCRDLPWSNKPDFFLTNLQRVQTAIQKCRHDFFKTTEFITTYATIRV